MSKHTFEILNGGCPVEDFWPNPQNVYTLDLTCLLPPCEIQKGRTLSAGFIPQPGVATANNWMITNGRNGGDFILVPALTVRNLLVKAFRAGLIVRVLSVELINELTK